MRSTLAFLGLICLFGVDLNAATVELWNEGTMGDLSDRSGAPGDAPGVPTQLGILLPASGGLLQEYRVLGETENGGGDFFTVQIGAGDRLVSIVLREFNYLSEDVPPNERAFFMGLGSGDTFPSGYDEFNANQFPFPESNLADWIGGRAINQGFIGTDILPLLDTIQGIGTGIDPPLGPGFYSFVIQQTGEVQNSYVLDFGVMSASAIPEPASASVLSLIAGSVWCLRRRRLAKRR